MNRATTALISVNEIFSSRLFNPEEMRVVVASEVRTFYYYAAHIKEKSYFFSMGYRKPTRMLKVSFTRNGHYDQTEETSKVSTSEALAAFGIAKDMVLYLYTILPIRIIRVEAQINEPSRIKLYTRLGNHYAHILKGTLRVEEDDDPFFGDRVFFTLHLPRRKSRTLRRKQHE